VLRKWVKEFAAAPAGAFPGHGQVKPEQLEMCLFPQGNLRSAVTPLAQLGMLGTTVNLGEGAETATSPSRTEPAENECEKSNSRYEFFHRAFLLLSNKGSEITQGFALRNRLSPSSLETSERDR
jgi:hypothetical protein